MGEDRERRAAHKAVLLARCQRIRSHLQFIESASAGAKPSSPTPPPSFTFEALSDRTLLPFLLYIYTDRLEVPEEGQDDSLAALAVTADEFLMPRLLSCCEEKLIRLLSLRNAVYLFRLTDVISGLGELRLAAADFIIRSFHLLVVKGQDSRGWWRQDVMEEEQEVDFSPAKVLEMAFNALAE